MSIKAYTLRHRKQHSPKIRMRIFKHWNIEKENRVIEFCFGVKFGIVPREARIDFKGWLRLRGLGYG